VRFNDDAISMGVQAATHWDTLAHVSYSGRMYNGNPTSVVDETGATRLGAERLGPIVSRGVLLDLARAAGVERLDGGYALTPADLERAEEFGGVRVGSGDIVLLRTGQMTLLHAGDRMAYLISTAGPSMQTVRRCAGRAGSDQIASRSGTQQHCGSVAEQALVRCDPDPGAFDLPRSGLSTELPGHLAHLGERLRRHRLAEAGQPA